MSSSTQHGQVAVRVVLTTNEDGQEQVMLYLEGVDTPLSLTPSEARALATELITVAQRAEVKANLKVSQNLWRRVRQVQPRLLAAG